MIAALLLTVAMGIPLNEDFFIVSSVDIARSRLVVKRPTEVTVVIDVTRQTVIRAEKGESLRLSDLRAGDTIYVATKTAADGALSAMTIRRGPMTLEELHRRYLMPH